MDDDEEILKGPPWYDGYVLLYDGSEEDIEAIVRSRPEKRPGYLLMGSKYQAFIALSAASWEAFDAKVERVIGGRPVKRDVLKVPLNPRAPEPCPIKRFPLKAGESLAFGLANTGSLDTGNIDEAVRAIEALNVGLVTRVDGVVQILVEVQTASAELPAALTKLTNCTKIAPPAIIPARPV